MDIPTKTKIIELINEHYFNDIEWGLRGRSYWKTAGDICETLGYLCIGISAILAFSAGFFDIRFLSYIAGCVGTASGLLLKFSLYSMGESKERTDEINKILKKVGLDEVVDISPSTNQNNQFAPNPPIQSARKIIEV